MVSSREKGLVRFDKRTEEYQVISLKEKLRKSVDDILSLYRTQDGKMYVGTTSGLVCLSFCGKKIEATYIGREQGLLNDMIHGIQEDGNGFLWLGTNRGTYQIIIRKMARRMIIITVRCANRRV